MRLPKLRELGEAIRAVISGPYTTQFPFKPIIPPDGYRGKPQFYEHDCVGCNACAEVCPARAIEVVDDKEKQLRTLTHHQDICIYCQQCELACITGKGIILTKEFDLATFDRKSSITQSKKKLVICENCGEIIAPMDHIKFLAKKVGHLLYSNPTLLLARYEELAILEQQRIKESPHPRGDHLKMTCPNCRREVIIKEQW
ncbi:MAG: 4Fe-4S dicluster domain-containing protein [Candidatus Margulisiibacteriota bacterium]